MGIEPFQSCFTELDVFQVVTVIVQVLIDATGKANDATKRLQDRIPIEPTYDYPEYAVEATRQIRD